METDTMLAVNGTAVAPDAIAREMMLHPDAPDPAAAACRTLAIRELLLQRAGELGMLENGLPRERVTFAGRSDEDAVIAELLDREVRTPMPTADECRRYYDAHPERFTSGELVEARHILFALTPGTPVLALRTRAEEALAELRAQPARFAERARELSNCPSGENGGSLGQFGRGEMVPEFDRALFDTTATGVLPVLAATRYGFHVVEVARRIAGRQLPFEAVSESVAQYLAAQVEAKALRQYVEVLAGRADITGADLAGAATPLVQ
jgi:peptidyl-prolyl cis-trans isomerase C